MKTTRFPAGLPLENALRKAEQFSSWLRAGASGPAQKMPTVQNETAKGSSEQLVVATGALETI